MSNQSLEEDLSYLCIKEVRQPASPKLPPALQPRVRDGGGGRGVPIRASLTQKPQPHTYRAVPAIYKPPIRPADKPLAPPIIGPYPEELFFPPPPPPLVNPKMFQGHVFCNNDTFPLPPPPPDCHDYDPDTLTSTYYQHTNYGETSNAGGYDTRAVFVTESSDYGKGDGNQPSYANQTDVHLSGGLVASPQNSTSNYANVQSSGAAAPSLHPSLPTHTYAPITPNTTPMQYTSRPAGPVNSGGYIHNPSSRTAFFEASAAPMPKSDDLGTLSRKSGKEAEVDALTNLLMQNIESAGDPDFFGMCAKCGRKVVGQSNGCTAMDQVFHINCFVCASCGNILRGKSFYAIETKPYCEPCYVNTLEKCSVCSKPVIDRLLRATGKPYHPACFTCVVCGMSLDGVPFTVDATNQIHCIEDFHRKFAPRCCVCQFPIMPDPGKEETVRVVAMDKSFHVQCYCCEDCGLLLSSEAEGRGCYPLDDHILCKHCNAKRIQALTTKMASEH